MSEFTTLSWKTELEILISLALDAWIIFPLTEKQLVKVVFLSIERMLPPVIVNTAPIDPRQFCIREAIIFIYDLKFKLKKPVTTFYGVYLKNSLFLYVTVAFKIVALDSINVRP